MTTTARLLWAFGVICIALFVLATGRMNVVNYQDVQTSVEQIYEDRLVVKGLIFELSSLLHRKELAQVTGDATFYQDFNDAVDVSIDQNLEQFRATKLTEVEATTLGRFESHLAMLRTAEAEYDLAAGEELTPEQARALDQRMGELQTDLRELAEIQLQEGKRRMAIGERAENAMTWIAWVEGGLMVLLAGLLIALFFLPGPRTPSKPDTPQPQRTAPPGH